MSEESRARRLVVRMSHVERAATMQALLDIGAGQAGAPTRPWLPSLPRPAPGLARIADQPSLDTYAPLFASATWRAVWQPGQDYHLYVIGCGGLGQLAAALDLSLAKVGTCVAGDLDRRLGELRGHGYGGTVRRASGYAMEPGWFDWAPFAKLQVAPVPSACPIQPTGRSLMITAPLGWTPGEVEATVNEALAPYRLQQLADSEAGRLLCRERGVGPDTLLRYSRKGQRVVAATELTLIRPRVDAPRLAGLVAAAIARRVRTLASDPAAAVWQVLDQPVRSPMKEPARRSASPQGRTARRRAARRGT